MAKKAKQPKEIVLESRVQTAKLREDILEVMLEGDNTVIKSPRALVGVEVMLIDRETTSGCIAPPDAVYEVHCYYNKREENGRIYRYRLPGGIYIANSGVIIYGAEQKGHEHEISFKDFLR